MNYLNLENNNWRYYAEKLGRLDWSKDGELWKGNIVSDRRTILSQQHFIRQATKNVREAINWHDGKKE